MSTFDRLKNSAFDQRGQRVGTRINKVPANYPLPVKITAMAREMIWCMCVRELGFAPKGTPAHDGVLDILAWLHDMPEPEEK